MPRPQYLFHLLFLPALSYAATGAAELARLHQIFPEGVCDWSRPGVEQRDPLSPWITYTGVGTYKRDRDGEDD